jgi:uncharacterized protein with HEPN domain
MLDAVRRARELSEGKKLGELAPDDETALALTRLLEILGEAASRISSGLSTQKFPGETSQTPATELSTSTSTWTWR